MDLSGGQWQRIALARAFMRVPDVPQAESPTGGRSAAGTGGAEGGAAAGTQLLILDEPTAALDARAEHDLFLRFADLTRGRSTLLISHRFSTVKMADRIVVLEGGRIAEQGTHAELMVLGGTYADLYEKQASRYRQAHRTAHTGGGDDFRDQPD